MASTPLSAPMKTLQHSDMVELYTTSLMSPTVNFIDPASIYPSPCIPVEQSPLHSPSSTTACPTKPTPHKSSATGTCKDITLETVVPLNVPTQPQLESKENDPFNYEQHFPEDKQYEELGPFTRVWRTYLEECSMYDVEMLDGWMDYTDVLLDFMSATGLFSPVVTMFLIQTLQSLEVGVCTISERFWQISAGSPELSAIKNLPMITNCSVSSNVWIQHTYIHEFSNPIWRVTGVSQDQYEHVLCVDADTKTSKVACLDNVNIFLLNGHKNWKGRLCYCQLDLIQLPRVCLQYAPANSSIEALMEMANIRR
ncbi:hypothetical protein EDD18DRAFT_1103295 [Armillaria luteobubalina]|uniref:DUF6535 domain-containing protein n=1 Tax=Armillaria luteobubalina TaxID=153913 RepID=A0AA39UV76_9AGAR|nr:hypothetical protein EDD18DRAFT_1103295 [Armillaria luteobubalina]